MRVYWLVARLANLVGRAENRYFGHYNWMVSKWNNNCDLLPPIRREIYMQKALISTYSVARVIIWYNLFGIPNKPIISKVHRVLDAIPYRNYNTNTLAYDKYNLYFVLDQPNWQARNTTTFSILFASCFVFQMGISIFRMSPQKCNRLI